MLLGAAGFHAGDWLTFNTQVARQAAEIGLAVLNLRISDPEAARDIDIARVKRLFADNGLVVRQATKDDPRVTPLGRILRRTSLDELPQLFNVIEGNMSLVGPRPHASAHNEQYRRLIPGYMLRHKVKPGITGLAQVLGWRGETDTLDKMSNRIQCDLEYIRQWSLWMDLKILFKTVFVVFSRQNAY